MGVEIRDDLDRMLTRLKLTAVRDQLDTLLDEAARSEMTLRDALAFLCQREIARKERAIVRHWSEDNGERRIDMSFGLAKFPFVRDLDRLRLRRPALDRQGTDPRSRGRPLDRPRRRAIAARPPGRRQDASGRGARPRSDCRGYTVLFAAATALVANLAKAHADGRLDERLTHFAKPKLLIVDELGYLPFEPERRASVLPARSRVATSAARCWSPPTARSANGAPSSATPWWRRPSSIGCCTTATSSPSAATATGSARSAAAVRIASPEMLPDVEPLPHLKCSPAGGWRGERDEAGEHGDA